MPVLKMAWTPLSKPQFDELRQRALDAGKQAEFIQTHNEIVMALRDPTEASARGESLYKTKKPGGEVRHWIHGFISVCYVVFRDELVGWILKYQSVPAAWPE